MTDMLCEEGHWAVLSGRPTDTVCRTVRRVGQSFVFQCRAHCAHIVYLTVMAIVNSV